MLFLSPLAPPELGPGMVMVQMRGACHQCCGGGGSAGVVRRRVLLSSLTMPHSAIMRSWNRKFIRHEGFVMLKTVSASGQLTLGKEYSGRQFEVEERARGELVLRPVRLVRDTVATGRAQPARPAAFQIAEVEQVVMPARDRRNARPSEAGLHQPMTGTPSP